jgi:hypothetical protein
MVLEHAVAYGGGDGGLIGLDGGPTEFSVPVILDDGVFWPGKPAQLSLKSDGNSPIVARVVGAADRDQSDLERDLPLTSRPGTLDIAYFGQTAPDSPVQWSKDWPSSAGLPLLVRVSVTTPDEVPPPIYIRPGKVYAQSEMSLSSLLPPALPSRP